jgi:hypothetical protein
MTAPAPPPPRPPVTVLSLMDILTGWFAGPSWGAWRVLLAALFGLPMTEEQVATFQRFTGRVTPPTVPAREAYLVIGRRGGKSLIAALIALWAAVFRSYTGILAPGESAIVMVVASDRRQAKVIFRYLSAFFDRIPGLGQLIARRTQDALRLTNGISVEVHTCSYRAVRGPTVVAFIADELSFWSSEDSASPDREVLDAIRPAQATVTQPVFLCISSPYARKGELWRAYSQHWGRDDSRVLVWAADTMSMNPTVDPAVVREALEQDEPVAMSEYGRDGVILFRRDIEGYVSKETVEWCTIPGRRMVPPIPGIVYTGFQDPAGGSGLDAMAQAITHTEERDGRRVVVLDWLEERRPPFSPEQTVREFCDVLAGYGISHVVGDRYAGGWPAEQFAKHGVTYEPSGRVKSDIYRDALPLFSSGLVELLDLPKLAAQLVGLERRTARGGRDSIDHGPGGHDDLANSACGALVLAASGAEREEARIWGVG